MKKTRLWLAAPVLALSLFAVPGVEASAESGNSLIDFEPHITFEEITRETLAEGEKLQLAEIPNFVLQGSKNFETSRTFIVDINEKITSQNVQQLADKVSEKVREAFTLDEYVYGNRMRASWVYSYSLNTSVFSVTLEYTYPISIEKELATTKYVKDTAANIFKDGMTDFEKVKAAYEYIILTTDYGYTNEADGGGHSIYSIYNERKGVCQAYALLFQRLMDEAGIPAKYIVGDVGEAHAWNLVELDGETYFLDATHGDPVFSGGNGPKDYITYSRFLMTEQQLLANGYIIEEERPYKKPTSERYSSWHEIDHPFVWNGKMIYSTAAKELKVGNIVNGNIVSAVADSNSRPYNFTPVNGRILYYDNAKNNQLMELRADGTVHHVTTGYINDGHEKSSVQRIEIVDNEVLVYNYFSPTTIIYRETIQQQPAPQPEQPTEPEKTPEELEAEKQAALQADVEATFAANSPVVQKLATAKSEAAFKALLEELKDYVNVGVVHPKLQEFQVKAQGYKAVQGALNETTSWTASTPQVKEPKKPWTIQFNLQLKDEHKSKLYVTNIFNEKLAVDIHVQQKIVTVTPKKEYEKGATYYLVIPKGVTSEEGVVIEEGISLPFTFE